MVRQSLRRGVGGSWPHGTPALSDLPQRGPYTGDAPAEFSRGDMVDYHAITGGPVTSRGHKIVLLDGPTAWITRHRGCVDVNSLSRSEVRL